MVVVVDREGSGVNAENAEAIKTGSYIRASQLDNGSIRGPHVLPN